MSTADNILTSSEKFHICLGLDRVKKVLNGFDNPQDDLEFIHVAGTNGKGSTCAILSSILSSELKVGLFTSPHLFSYRERFKINGVEISQNELDEIINSLKDTDLTEFEMLTVAGFIYFKRHGVDVVVLETGLGGRLDATNVIKNPLVSIITSIGLEHTQRLGDTIELIGIEKAGIIKLNCPVVVNNSNLALDVIKKVAKDNNSPINMVEPVEPPCDFPLFGEFQKENLALALCAIRLLPFKISEKSIELGLKNVRWKFRMEYDKERNLLIDGCHNPDGARVLRNFLDEKFPSQRVRFIYGSLNNKDYNKVLDTLVKEGDELLIYEFNNPNCVKISEISKPARKITQPLNEIKGDILTVACGSLYMLGEIFQQEN